MTYDPAQTNSWEEPKVKAIRQVLCRRRRQHSLHAPGETGRALEQCDGDALLCTWCDNTARQIVITLREEPSW